MKKMVLLSCLVVIALFFVVSCAPSEEAEAFAGQAVKGKITYQSCVDSDEGNKPYVPGIIYLELTVNGVPQKQDLPDTYLTKVGKLQETKCNPYTVGQTKNPASRNRVSCPNGIASASLVSELTGKTVTASYCKCASDVDCPADYTSSEGLCSKKAAPT